MNEIDDIIRQLENMNLGYDELDNIQLFLINNSYIPIRRLVFQKECLKNKEFIFYEENEEYLIKSIEKGNRKTYNPYCQYATNGGLYYYDISKVEDIILNYVLRDVLEEIENMKVIEFLVKNYGIERVSRN